MAQPNRLIKLFQQKADNALGEYVMHREKVVGRGISEWTTAEVSEGARLYATMQTWQKAADLLRAEELRNGR